MTLSERVRVLYMRVRNHSDSPFPIRALIHQPTVAMVVFFLSNESKAQSVGGGREHGVDQSLKCSRSRPDGNPGLKVVKLKLKTCHIVRVCVFAGKLSFKLTHVII